MDFLWDKITEWLKEMLIGGIVSNLSGMFDATNQKVAEISGQVGLIPAYHSIFSLPLSSRPIPTFSNWLLSNVA